MPATLDPNAGPAPATAICAVVLAMGGLVLAGGCSDANDTAAVTQVAESSTEAFARQAHAAALTRARPHATTLLQQIDPVAAWELEQTSSTAPPLSRASLARILPLEHAARREFEGIDPQHLTDLDGVRLAVLRFALDRLREHVRQPPSRTDPQWSLQHIDAVLDVLSATPDCSRCSEVFTSLAAELEAAARDLGGASGAGLDGALDHLVRLRQRVDHFAPGERTAGAVTMLEAVEVAHRTWSAQRAALPEHPTRAWEDAMAPAEGEPRIERLPDVLGSAALRRRLEVEEAVQGPLVAVVPAVLGAMKQLDAIASLHTLPEAASDPLEPLDDARCEAARVEVETWLQSRGQHLEPTASCMVTLRRLEPRSSDAALRLAILEWGWVRPRARDQRRAMQAPEGLVSGHIASTSQRRAAVLAAAVHGGDGPSIALALQRVREALCRAQTAVWIHGELSEPAKLEAWLRADCGWRDPADWIAEVLADPRQALGGLGLVMLAHGPAGAVTLDRFGWAPIGLVPALADPARFRSSMVVDLAGAPTIEWLAVDGG